MLKQAESEETIAFWNNVDPDATADLSEFQKDAIFEAVRRRATEGHKADIRLSAFGYFFVVLFGKERRSKTRLKDERRRRPVVTFNNILMIVILWGSLIFTLYSLLPYAVKGILNLIL
ncbi:hypothetical protein [Roseibium sp.]|uniref:hypothetical protein n=1 Tax=Roseibium sp. TaxID=1936156 RepID=UPI003D12BA1A